MGFSAGLRPQARCMWNVTGDGKQVKELGGHNDDILKLVAHPTKPIFVTTSADKTVKVWDEDKGTNTVTLNGMTDHVFAAAISADGSLVAAGAYDGEVKVWKIADATVVKAFNASPGYAAPAVQTRK